MNKRVREIVKMHLDTGLICKNTPISIIDLSAGKRVDVCAGSRWITKYLEREVGAYKLSERNGLCIMVKSQEEPEIENPYSKKEAQDPDELIPELLEALDDAGINEVIQAKQEQLDAFLAAK